MIGYNFPIKLVPPESIDIRVNARPSKTQIDELCLAVGWSAFGDDYPAVLDGYSVTTSAWSAERLVAWTSVVSDNFRTRSYWTLWFTPRFSGVVSGARSFNEQSTPWQPVE